MIRKVLAIALTIVMCLGASVTALADESTEISFIDAVYVGEGVAYHDELSAWRIFLASTTKSLRSEPIPTYEVGTALLILISDGMQNGQTAYLGFNEWHKNYGLPEQALLFAYGDDVPPGGVFVATEDMIGDVITIRNIMYGIDIDIMVEMPDSIQSEPTPKPNYGTIDSDYWSKTPDNAGGKGILTYAFSTIPEMGELWNESLSQDRLTNFPYVIPVGTEFRAVGSESGVGIELCSFKDSDFEYFPYESLVYGMNAREIGERIISQWPREEGKQYYFEEGFSYVFNEPGKYLILIGNDDINDYRIQGDFALHAIAIQVEPKQEPTPRPTPQLAPEVLSQLSFEVKTITGLTDESQIDTWIWDFERDFLESVGIPFLSPFSTYILSSNEPLKISEITGKVAGWERTQKEFIFPSDTYITIGYATEDGIIRGVLGVCLYELDDDGNVVVGDALFWDENPIETLLDSTMIGKRISTSPSSTEHKPFYVVVEPIAVDELTTPELAVVVDEITTPEQTVDEDEIITVDEATILEPAPEQINNVGIVVNCYFLNLRSGASMRHAVINYLAAGDTVTVIDQNSGWYHVETQKGIGWVYGVYLTVNNN